VRPGPQEACEAYLVSLFEDTNLSAPGASPAAALFVLAAKHSDDSNITV
jgi:hypothetical protein